MIHLCREIALYSLVQTMPSQEIVLWHTLGQHPQQGQHPKPVWKGADVLLLAKQISLSIFTFAQMSFPSEMLYACSEKLLALSINQNRTICQNGLGEFRTWCIVLERQIVVNRRYLENGGTDRFHGLLNARFETILDIIVGQTNQSRTECRLDPCGRELTNHFLGRSVPSVWDRHRHDPCTDLDATGHGRFEYRLDLGLQKPPCNVGTSWPWPMDDSLVSGRQTYLPVLRPFPPSRMLTRMRGDRKVRLAASRIRSMNRLGFRPRW